MFDVSLEDENLMHASHSHFVVRTSSTPTLNKTPPPIKARRTISVLNKPNLQYEAWHMKTQGLFRSLRSSESQKLKSRMSNRLTSHHSSSSEEWYLEFQELEEKLNNFNEKDLSESKISNQDDVIVYKLNEKSNTLTKESQIEHENKVSTRSKSGRKKKTQLFKCLLI